MNFKEIFDAFIQFISLPLRKLINGIFVAVIVALSYLLHKKDIELEEGRQRDRMCAEQKLELQSKFAIERDSLRITLTNAYIQLLKDHNKETIDALNEQKEINMTIEKTIQHNQRR